MREIFDGENTEMHIDQGVKVHKTALSCHYFIGNGNGDLPLKQYNARSITHLRNAFKTKDNIGRQSSILNKLLDVGMSKINGFLSNSVGALQIKRVPNKDGEESLVIAPRDAPLENTEKHSQPLGLRAVFTRHGLGMTMVTGDFQPTV